MDLHFQSLLGFVLLALSAAGGNTSEGYQTDVPVNFGLGSWKGKDPTTYGVLQEVCTAEH